ncbi:MAG: hypothetical protein WDW36_006704 [Sanguina aurantia]
MSRKRSELYAQLGWARRSDTASALEHSALVQSNNNTNSNTNNTNSNNHSASLSPDSTWQVPQCTISTTLRAHQRRPTSTPSQTREHSNSPSRAGLTSAGSGRASAVAAPSGMGEGGRPHSRQRTPNLTAEAFGAGGQGHASDIQPSILEHCAGLRPTLLSLREEQLPESRAPSPRHRPHAISAWKEAGGVSIEEQEHTHTQAGVAASGGRGNATPHFLWSSPGTPLGGSHAGQGRPSREGSSFGGPESPTGTRSGCPNGRLDSHRRSRRHHVEIQDILSPVDIGMNVTSRTTPHAHSATAALAMAVNTCKLQAVAMSVQRQYYDHQLSRLPASAQHATYCSSPGGLVHTGGVIPPTPLPKQLPGISTTSGPPSKETPTARVPLRRGLSREALLGPLSPASASNAGGQTDTAAGNALEGGNGHGERGSDGNTQAGSDGTGAVDSPDAASTPIAAQAPQQQQQRQSQQQQQLYSRVVVSPHAHASRFMGISGKAVEYAGSDEEHSEQAAATPAIQADLMRGGGSPAAGRGVLRATGSAGSRRNQSVLSHHSKRSHIANHSLPPPEIRAAAAANLVKYSLNEAADWVLASRELRSMAALGAAAAEAAALKGWAAAEAARMAAEEAEGVVENVGDTSEELRTVKFKRQDSSSTCGPVNYTRVARSTHTTLPGNTPLLGSSAHLAAFGPDATLQWSNRGIGTSKMAALESALLQYSKTLVVLCLAGNKISNDDVAELLSILALPGSPRIQELDLSCNTALTWRAALPIAMSMGATLGEHGPTPTGYSGRPIGKVTALRRLGLSGLKLGERGALQLAAGLRVSNTMQHLDLSRCSITDAGGAGIFDALGANGSLTSLDLSWNVLRSDSAVALQLSMPRNPSLHMLRMGHNGFSDVDGARIFKGLLSHGSWHHLDLSHNSLGPGSAMMLCEVIRHLGLSAASYITPRTYARHWLARGDGATPDGRASAQPTDTRSPSPSRTQHSSHGDGDGGGAFGGGGGSAPGSHGKPKAPRAHMTLGSQLAVAPVEIVIDGNPLGLSGMRLLIDALDKMSICMHAAAEGQAPGPALPWPLQLHIQNCNIAITDRSARGEEASSNPHLPCISTIMEGATSGKGGGKGKAKGATSDGKNSPSKGKKDKKKGKSAAKPAEPLVLSAPSQSLDLLSPAGRYRLDMSHPASHRVLDALRELQKELEAAVQAGRVVGVALALTEVQLNDKPLRADKLEGLAQLGQGYVTFVAKAPAVLLTKAPGPVSDDVVDWLAAAMSQPGVAELWKLATVEAAAAQCYFLPEQCWKILRSFDREVSSSECLAAAVVLYARSVQPLHFWTTVIRRFSASHQALLHASIGDLPALDALLPAGHYALNLSRPLDRLVALRLQAASALEHSWRADKYFLNWQNASLDNRILTKEGLSKIRDYTIPNIGTLRVDYVTYQVPSAASAHEVPPAAEGKLVPRVEPKTPGLAILFKALRAANSAFTQRLLVLRVQFPALHCKPVPAAREGTNEHTL